MKTNQKKTRSEVESMAASVVCGSELEQIAKHNGMRTLREDGVLKIREGITTPAEILKATRDV